MISTFPKLAFILTTLIVTGVFSPTAWGQNKGVSDEAFFKALSTYGDNGPNAEKSVFSPPQDQVARTEFYDRLIVEAQDPSLKRAYEIMRQADTRGDTRLDLSKLGLIAFPNVPSNVTELILDNNRISELPPRIGRLAKLEKLSVQNNQLTDLPREVGKLTRLKIFDLRGNDLITAPPELWRIRSLQVLRIETSAIPSHPLSDVAIPVNDLGRLTELSELHVVGFFKHHVLASDGILPRQIGTLTKLRKLVLRNNAIGSLPPEIGNLTNLKVLDVSNNFLSQLPDEIGRLENLITLDAGRNVYCNISPEIFGQLKKLERLDFAGCNIEKIPDNLLELPRLRELHVSKVEPGPQSEVLWKLTNLTTLSIGFLRDEGQLAAGIGRLINLEELSLAGSCLQVIPNEIGRLSRLKSLDLSDNSYQFSLPPEIANLTRLKTLNLQGCELKQFPAVITKLEGLESLNLRDNSFSELPSEFWNLTNLKSLRMGTWDGYKAFSAHLTPEIANFRNLVELDLEGMVNLTDDEVPQNNVLSALGTLTKLEKLNLSYTELSDLSWIGDLTSLRELNCAFTSLKVIPSEIRNLKFLQTADFSFCGALTRMSIDVGQLKKLLILDLTGCGGIESLPAQIGRLRSLQELRFDSTLTYSLGPRPLTTLPKEIGQLKNLEVLRLRDHNLSALPIEIGGLMRLKELQLSGNKLTSLPIEIGGLMRLKELQLSGNKLTSLPESIGTLSNLRQIDCSDNQLESLPSTIGGLRELAELSLHNNRLKTLPPQIGQLAKLNRLSLKGNKIESLPVEIGKLKQLNKLDLAGQQLTELPRTIGDLERLRHLNLASNRLDSLPRSIGKLKQLEVLGIGGNLLKDLPAELQNLNNLIVLDIAGNELNRSALESLTKIDRLEELWLTNYTLTFSYLSDAWLGVSKAEKKAEREAERKKKLAKYFGDSSEIAGEAKPQSDTVQLKLPPFPEGTGPSEKAIAFLSKHGDFENGVFIEKYIAKDGKAGTRKAKFYKLPKNMVSSNHLSEMTGYVIAFNQFIPLPKWDFNDRLITFYADSRRGPNAFMFGYDPDKARHQFYICMKRNTSNTTYLMKNFAYKFEEGGSIFNCCRGADNNPIDACVFGKKTDGNSADIARNLTRPAYNSDSPPLFSYFAPKGMTAWEAIQDAEEKMKEKEKEKLRYR